MWFYSKSRTARLRRNLAHADGFRTRLETDRLRADRMGIPLTLVTLKWREGDDPGKSTARVFDLVDARLRATDELGRLADNELGVVLWNTNEFGATVFVDRLLGAADDDLKLEATLFAYPVRGQRPDDQRHQKDDADEVDNERNDPDANRPNDPPSNAGSSDEKSTDTPAAQQIPVEPLEPAMASSLSPLRRMIDIVGASVGLLVAAPIIGIAALAIKIADPGSAFFSQTRAGLGGKPFKIYKLRTMIADAEKLKRKLRANSEQDGPAFKMEQDPRVFRIGNFLRRTSIDELPQLLNVLRGEMSLVGPRPLPVDEAERVAGWQRRRLDVMPGLTCIWQVEGRSRVTFIEWMRMDMKYIQQRSFWSDLQLMFATVPAVLLRRGAK